jgi:hypothetical protein
MCERACVAPNQDNYPSVLRQQGVASKLFCPLFVMPTLLLAWSQSADALYGVYLLVSARWSKPR